MATFSPEWLPVLLLFLVPFLSMIFLKNKKKTVKGVNLPPSPPKLPIIGNLHQLGKLPHQSLHKLSRKYGPVMLLQLGKIPTVVISSAEMAKQVMKDHDLECCSRPNSSGPQRLSYNFLDVAFSPYTDYWREMRKLFIFELVSMKRVQSFAYAREAEVDKLINALSQASSNPVNLTEKIFALLDGIISTVAFGKIYGTNQFKDQKFEHILEESLSMLASFSAEDFFPSSIGRFIDNLSGLCARREKIFRNLDGYFQTILDWHLDPARPKPDHEDLVDVLIGLMKNQIGTFRLTNEHVKAILMNTFVGAIDTSSITILWAMTELIRNPRVMKKVQAETRSCIGKKARVDTGDVANLKYLKMVVKETFRLHPAAALLIPRETMRHCKIGGYDILPQTRMFINGWAIGRDPDGWKNPNEFYPERFEDKDIDYNGSHFELIPFGAGRRICPGLAMGAANVHFTLANLLYCFDWELPNGMKRADISLEEEGILTTGRKTPLYLVPIRHNWQE